MNHGLWFFIYNKVFIEWMEGIRIQETCWIKLFDIFRQVCGVRRKIGKDLDAKILAPFSMCCQILGSLELCVVFMLWISEFT